MGARTVSKTRWLALSCLLLGQLGAHSLSIPAGAAAADLFAEGIVEAAPGTVAPILPTATISASAKVYEQAFDLAFRIMRHKLFYGYLNETFAASIQMPGGKRGAGLSLSQIVFILQNAQPHWKDVETYLKKVPVDQAEEPAVLETREKFRQIFTKFASNETLMKEIIKHNDASQPLLLRTSDGDDGFTGMEMFVNHPSLEDPSNPASREIPADDLRQLVIDFIKGAKEEIYFNVFDFDSKEIASAFVERNKNGVRIKGGIDKSVHTERAEVREVEQMLNDTRNKNLNVRLVDSVGLNHQKMIVRDPHGPNAAVLLLSGNFTQSCLGPEGDAVRVPPELRPKESIPNANHAILIKGELPAVVVRQELRKTLNYGVRGESQYPLGGAFQIQGPFDPVTKKPTSIILTFSPNGGLGDINRDILARLVGVTKGPTYAAQFAFSSDTLTRALLARTAREVKRLRDAGKPALNLFLSVGDKPFAMRDWSSFLTLSGYEQDPATKRYSEIPEFPLKTLFKQNEFSAWRENIRIAPRIYGDRQIKLGTGETAHVTSKIHHKVFIFPESHIAVVGTSFNVSNNAEKNNEQILIVNDSRIAHRSTQMFAWLYKNSESSVAAEATRRNRLPPRTDPGTSEPDPDGEPMTRGTLLRTCPALFLKTN